MPIDWSLLKNFGAIISVGITQFNILELQLADILCTSLNCAFADL